MACKRREQRKRAKLREKQLTVMTMNEFIHAKEMLKKADVPFGYIGTKYHKDDLVLGEPKKEKDTKMNYANLSAVAVSTAAETDLSKAKQYLHNRLCEIRQEKWSALYDHFGLNDDQFPRTPEDLVKRIQEGKFVLPEDDKSDLEYDYYSAGDLVRAIKWRDPSKKKDKDGFKAAEVLLNAAETKARDKIAVYDPEKGLKALEEFETKQFH